MPTLELIADIANLKDEVASLKKLLKHIRYQANERLEDGHGYEMMLTTTIIEIDAALGNPTDTV